MQVSTYSPYASTLSQNASAFSQSNQLQTASTRPNNVTADTLMFGAKYTYDKNKERKVRQVINNHNLTSAHVRLTRNKVIVTINSDEAETFTNGMK